MATNQKVSPRNFLRHRDPTGEVVNHLAEAGWTITGYHYQIAAKSPWVHEQQITQRERVLSSLIAFDLSPDLSKSRSQMYTLISMIEQAELEVKAYLRITADRPF